MDSPIKSNGKQSDSYKFHQRQTAWQIFIPLCLAVAMIIAVAVLAAMSTFRNPADGTRYSSISLIWILLPALITGSIFVLVMVGMIYGMGKLLEILPTYTWKVQTLASLASLLVKKYSDKIVAPVMVVRGWSAGTKILKQRIRSTK